MFGYIKIYEDELKIKEYKIYKSYYCGLCKALGKRYGALSRLGLSYDLTFFALVCDSVETDKNDIEFERCFKHIGAKQPVCDNKFTDIASDLSILLAYEKIKDDICDGKNIFKYFKYLMLVPYIKSYKKNSHKYADISKSISYNLKRLGEYERQNECDTDKAADCFAVILRDCFGYFNKELKDFGYAVGRYVYCADAFDDLKNDLKSGGYNPYKYKFMLESADDDKLPLAAEAIKNSLYITLSMLAECTEKLKFKKNENIIKNIVYMGMRKITDDIKKKYEV